MKLWTLNVCECGVQCLSGGDTHPRAPFHIPYRTCNKNWTRQRQRHTDIHTYLLSSPQHTLVWFYCSEKSIKYGGKDDNDCGLPCSREQAELAKSVFRCFVGAGIAVRGGSANYFTIFHQESIKCLERLILQRINIIWRYFPRLSSNTNRTKCWLWLSITYFDRIFYSHSSNWNTKQFHFALPLHFIHNAFCILFLKIEITRLDSNTFINFNHLATASLDRMDRMLAYSLLTPHSRAHGFNFIFFFAHTNRAQTFFKWINKQMPHRT